MSRYTALYVLNHNSKFNFCCYVIYIYAFGMLDVFVYADLRKLDCNEWDALGALVAGNQIQNIIFSPPRNIL